MTIERFIKMLAEFDRNLQVEFYTAEGGPLDLLSIYVADDEDGQTTDVVTIDIGDES